MSVLLKIAFLFSALVLAVLRSCGGSASSLPVSAYINWVEDEQNGLVVSKTIGRYSFTVQYKPSPYVVLQDEKRSDFSEKQFDSLVTAISDMDYYTLKIGAEGNKDLTRFGLNNDQEYYARQEYLSTQLQQDIRLIDGSDTLNCLLYHYERTYGIDPQASIVLAFENKTAGKAVGNKTIVIDDRHFGTGPVMLTISAQALGVVPQLTLN